MQCFRRAGKQLGIDVRVFAADCVPELSAACQLADACFTVPRCDHEHFVPSMLDLCGTHEIGLLIPTIDPELGVFASHRESFDAIGTLVSVSSPEVVDISRNKLCTAEFFASIGVPTPRTLPWTPGLEPAVRFPIIIKPVEGSSSIGTLVIRCSDEFAALKHRPSSIVQEYWEGEEYTVNLFFDRNRLCSAIPHLRLETRSGEVSKAVTKRLKPLSDLAERLGGTLGGRAFGALCFQAIVSLKGEIVVLELNARFGGGYPLADQAGATFAKWLLELRLGLECSAHNEWETNLQMLRYDTGLFRKMAV